MRCARYRRHIACRSRYYPTGRPQRGRGARGAAVKPADLAVLPIGSHRVRCEHCGKGPTDKTLGVTVEHDGAVFHCFRCGLAGSHHHDREVIRHAPIRTPSVTPKLEWSTLAESIWQRTQALRGTLGEVYLQHRGCALPPRDSHLRYLPPDDRHPPTLCAAITDARTGKPLSLHFTRLAADGRGKVGTDFDKLLLKGHRKAGGVIRLWPNEAVATGLCIAEGIETALAAAHAYEPVWACVDASNLEAFPVLDGIECLVIVADHDERGLGAAAKVGQRWADAGRETSITTPDATGTDLADLAVAS
ncbi:MAG: toprim domain-containing protein [Gammaproteobacteria bacterium]|nr:toprim domain-containing protein [Gammaproteobacteria bacterium]